MGYQAIERSLSHTFSKKLNETPVSIKDYRIGFIREQVVPKIRLPLFNGEEPIECHDFKKKNPLLWETEFFPFACRAALSLDLISKSSNRKIQDIWCSNKNADSANLSWKTYIKESMDMDVDSREELIKFIKSPIIKDIFVINYFLKDKLKKPLLQEFINSLLVKLTLHKGGFTESASYLNTHLIERNQLFSVQSNQLRKFKLMDNYFEIIQENELTSISGASEHNSNPLWATLKQKYDNADNKIKIKPETLTLTVRYSFALNKNEDTLNPPKIYVNINSKDPILTEFLFKDKDSFINNLLRRLQNWFKKNFPEIFFSKQGKASFFSEPRETVPPTNSDHTAFPLLENSPINSP